MKNVAQCSNEALREIEPSAGALRTICLSYLTEGNYTADEIAGFMGKSVLTIRPRIAELHKAGKIEPTGTRRVNASGAFATVWRVKV